MNTYKIAACSVSSPSMYYLFFCSAVLLIYSFVQCSEQEKLDSELLAAVRCRNVAQAKMLIAQQANVNVQDGENGWTPLMMVANKGDSIMMHMLLGARADIAFKHKITQETALHVAASRGNKKRVRILIGAGADCASLDRWGATPLMVAARSSDVNSLQDPTTIFQVLLDKKANINHQNYDGETALHCAVSIRYVDTVRALLALGADHSKADKRGDVPLRKVLEHEIGDGSKQEAMVSFLLNAKANVNHKMGALSTPLSLALYYRHTAVAECLLIHGGTVNRLQTSDKDQALAIYNQAMNRVPVVCAALYAKTAFPCELVDIISQYYFMPLSQGSLS